MIGKMGDNNMCNCTIDKGDCSIFTRQPVSYAMAYVPYQSWEKLYAPEVALDRGTIFPCLDKPFIGEEAVPNDR